jgi:hypothetical protein
MATPGSTQPETSDEIDLGQLFQLIGRGFRSLFRGFLSIYLYFKKNFFWLAGLVVLGGLTGFIVNQLVDERQKLDVIVTPNLDTRNYLYDVVAEVQADIKARDTAFFRSLDMDFKAMEGFELEVAPLKVERQNSPGSTQMLETLKDFRNSEAIAEMVREELSEQITRDQRLTFYFKNPEIGAPYAGKVLEYINSNPYYQQLLEIQRTNAAERIERNDSLVRQIDLLINTYTDKLASEQTSPEGRLILENQESLDIPSLFEQKNRLIRDIETKRLELEREKEPITVVNFGKPHKVTKPLFRKNLILFPLLFLGAFLLVSLIRYLNRKASELNP